MAKTQSGLLDQLFNDFVQGGDYELGIIWQPGMSNSVGCGHLRVNGLVLATDQEFRHSPQVFRLPASY